MFFQAIYAGIRNTFAHVNTRSSSVTSAAMRNAKVYRQPSYISSKLLCLKLGSDVFTFTVKYDNSDDYPYPHTEKYSVGGTYRRTNSSLVFEIETMDYHCTVEDDLFPISTETKFKIVEADVTTPTLSRRLTTPDSLKTGVSNVYGTLKVPMGFFEMKGEVFADATVNGVARSDAAATDTDATVDRADQWIKDTADNLGVSIDAIKTSTLKVTPAAAESDFETEKATPVPAADVVVTLRHFAAKWSNTSDGSEWRSADSTHMAVFPLQSAE